MTALLGLRPYKILERDALAGGIDAAVIAFTLRIVAWLRAGRPRSWSLIPGKGKMVYLFSTAPRTALGTYTASYTMDAGS
jgi:hypothetical protein